MTHSWKIPQQTEALSSAIDRSCDVIVGHLRRKRWIVQGGFAGALMLQIALLAHTLTLTH